MGIMWRKSDKKVVEVWVNFINPLKFSCSLCFNDDVKSAKKFIRKLHGMGIMKTYLITKYDNKSVERKRKYGF